MNKNINENISEDESQEKIQKFMDELEGLMEKYDIEEYICVLTICGKEIASYKPTDILTITNRLKNVHRNFYNQVMQRIGEC